MVTLRGLTDPAWTDRLFFPYDGLLRRGRVLRERAVRVDASKARQRGGRAGHALEDHTREQLYDLAQKRNIRGRSKMGKWELIRALRS